MKPSQLIQFLNFSFANGFPILIKGKPGIGKTDCVTQAATATGYDLYISHPVVSDPTDYKGLPFVSKDQKSAEFLPFGDLNKLLNPEKPLVYFLDDLGQASASVQAACMQLLLARRINGHHVSDKVVFVAATNRREDKAGVQGMLEPVKSRFASIVELDIDIDDWIAWALRNDMPAELLGFLRFRPDTFDNAQPSKDMVNSPCPRTFAHVGKLINAGINKNIEYEVFQGSCGEAFATEFSAFLRVYRDLPSIEDIMQNPKRTQIPSEPSSLYALCGAIARRVTKENIDQLMSYVERIQEEFQVYIVKDMIAKDSTLIKTPSLTQWATKNHKLLLI